MIEPEPSSPASFRRARPIIPTLGRSLSSSGRATGEGSRPFGRGNGLSAPGHEPQVPLPPRNSCESMGRGGVSVSFPRCGPHTVGVVGGFGARPLRSATGSSTLVSVPDGAGVPWVGFGVEAD
jgi:hypothetical protein